MLTVQSAKCPGPSTPPSILLSQTQQPCADARLRLTLIVLNRLILSGVKAAVALMPTNVEM